MTRPSEGADEGSGVREDDRDAGTLTLLVVDGADDRGVLRLWIEETFDGTAESVELAGVLTGKGRR